MNQVIKIVINGAKWVWKNSWWIFPAGEEIYDTIKKKFRKKPVEKDTNKK